MKVKGLVIKNYDIENHKMITVLTETHGKIQIKGYGAKSFKSKAFSVTQNFYYCEFELKVLNKLYYIKDAEILENFSKLRNDIIKLAFVNYFCELADMVINDNTDDAGQLRLLLNTLHKACYTDFNLKLLKNIYELRLISLSGFKPNLTYCNFCKEGVEIKDSLFFHIESGCIVCEECAGTDCIEISKSAFLAVCHILYSDIKKLFSFNVSDRVLNELETFISIFIEYHIGYELKSLKYLNNILEFNRFYSN